MQVYFVRHGESDANVAGIVNDDPARAVALTARGRAQAIATARRLAGLAFSAAYCSELLRARQTAEILLAELGLSGTLALHVDARLNERRSGLDGQPVETFHALVRSDPVHTRPAKGESFLEQMERLRAFLDDLATRSPRGAVLAVSHESPIMAATALAGAPVEAAARGGLGNGEWVVLDWPTGGRSERLLTSVVP